MSFNIIDHTCLKMAPRKPPPPGYSATSLIFLNVLEHLLSSFWAFSVEGLFLGSFSAHLVQLLGNLITAQGSSYNLQEHASHTETSFQIIPLSSQKHQLPTWQCPWDTFNLSCEGSGFLLQLFPSQPSGDGSYILRAPPDKSLSYSPKSNPRIVSVSVLYLSSSLSTFLLLLSSG